MPETPAAIAAAMLTYKTRAQALDAGPAPADDDVFSFSAEVKAQMGRVA